MYVRIKHSLAHLQDSIPTLAGNRECFLYTYIWLHMFELTVASDGCWMIAISNWLAICFLPFIVTPTPFLISKLLQHLVFIK